MDNKFVALFEKMNSLNISLFVREKEMLEIQSIINFLNGDITAYSGDISKLNTLRSYYKELKRLQKLQERDSIVYNNYHQKFLGYINSCDIEVLQNYARELTKKELKFKNDCETLESNYGNPSDVQRLKLIAKTYYDSIESIYKYIDIKLNSMDIKKLKKTN